MARTGTIDLTTTDPEAITAIDTLMRELEMAQIALRSAEADYEEAAQRERVALENAKIVERFVRDRLFATMEEHGVPTVKDGSNTAVVVQRHDYVIENEDDMRKSLVDDFGPDGMESLRTWDMVALKNLARDTRKTRGHDYRGMKSVPKRYLQVTQKTSEG